ncbi:MULTISPECIES: glycosyltransferase family 4 protein [Bacillus]|uniref:Glycosyltransferase family 1 protein n=1 Tax=Bacillus pseudomycoides TaxID=64104 RepID=A0AAJ3R950_9BACI|nr:MULTISPECIES: glycosyltransferase family 1 protein [Bacillus cereus group]EEM09225.1 Glycosyl transferase, group 1 [Bacillus pseudomycoides]KFN13853.1 glycosyl transferases group 1 family protein [Bacillus pseudomycoides]MBJ8028085.1 glycosyltransferase family 1 protein [Bacillus cereus group sp. N21]MCR8857503.1 glycosyltransferase family 1 protein [Bacillus pseudomycoides]MDR4186378.1 glycosyltransferase family 1 protein [Bacillus pseudomycoides]
MRVAIFTDTFTPQVNGVAKTLDRLTLYFQKQNIAYSVFAPQHTAEDDFVANVNKMRSIPLKILYPECRFAFPTPRIKRELLNFQPDIIHVATPFNMGLCGMYYAKKLNIPLVGSYHTDFDSYLQYYKIEFFSNMLWNYLKWFHSSMQKNFVPSPETLQQLTQKGFRNLYIWGRGVDCSLFHQAYNKDLFRKKYNITAPYILSYIGRIAPEKDIETLRTLIHTTIKERKDNIHWLIAGDGPLAEELRETLPANVTFTGYLQEENLAEAYACSDLMVFPSATETFGNVVLESLACGTPVVGANSGGVKNIITDGKTGFLCEPKNSNSFLSSIYQLLNNEEMRKQMGIAARFYATTQSWDEIFHGLYMQYEEVLHQNNTELLA